jgi:integrase/recombinase XerD
MERTYQSAAALVGRAAGPLANHIGAFVSSLIDQQYSASVIYIRAQHALAFDRWLVKRGLVLADLSELSATSTGCGADTNVSAVRPGAVKTHDGT